MGFLKCPKQQPGPSSLIIRSNLRKNHIFFLLCELREEKTISRSCCAGASWGGRTALVTGLAGVQLLVLYRSKSREPGFRLSHCLL